MAELSARLAELDWYHTLELAPGVVTPGWFDLRGVPRRVRFPESLAGRRCLDIGTFDGFWAFEMEQRGASEVVAIDLLDPTRWDWPAGSADTSVAEIGRRKGRGAGFELAREMLGSQVQRHEVSVYDLADAGLGEFDFVYLGSLLLHLRDPVRALGRIRGVCRGTLLVVDAVDVGLTIRAPRAPVARLDGRGRPWWWKPNLAALTRMLEAGGFRPEGRARLVRMPAGPGRPPPPLAPATFLTRIGREEIVAARLGDPHASLTASPA